MSYGHPCSRTTAGPLAGPASAYPTFRRPALICFSEPNEVFVPGLIWGTCAGLVWLDWASAERIVLASPAAPRVMVAFRKNRRRLLLVSSDILIVLIGESPLFD